MPFMVVRFVTFIDGFSQEGTQINTRTGVLPIALVGVAVARLRAVGKSESAPNHEYRGSLA
jgi:hypothetical protein